MGYERVVIGGRGPYIEFADHQIQELAFESPIGVHHVYYIEGRSRLSDVKLYFQLKPVDYADYASACSTSPRSTSTWTGSP